jgi:alpha-glucosidase
VLIGEIYLPLQELVQYYGIPVQRGTAQLPAPETQELNGANLPFNFHLIQTEWKASAIAQIIQRYEQLLPPGGWPNYVLGNHDQPRLASRVGAKQARVAGMLLLTLRGTPTMYYGDELGMEDVAISPAQVKDPAEKNEPGKGRGRDPERSPMLWVNAPNAGFTAANATPWLPLESDWPTKNAAAQRSDSKSMLTLYRKLLALRRQHDTLHAGAISDVAAEGNVLRYVRRGLPQGESSDFQVLLNLGSELATVNCDPGTVVVTTMLDGAGARVDGEVTMEAGEGLLIALD